MKTGLRFVMATALVALVPALPALAAPAAAPAKASDRAMGRGHQRPVQNRAAGR